MKPDTQPVRLGALLVAAGGLTRAQLDEALAQQAKWGDKLGQQLLALGFVDEVTLMKAIAHQTGLPAVDLDHVTLAPGATSLVPVGVAECYGLLPLGVRAATGALMVACIDPTDEAVLRAAREASGLALECWVATASSIDRAIRRHYYGEASGPVVDSHDPSLNLTRDSFNREPAAATLDDRVAALEREVAELKRQLAALRPGPR